MAPRESVEVDAPAPAGLHPEADENGHAPPPLPSAPVNEASMQPLMYRRLCQLPMATQLVGRDTELQVLMDEVERFVTEAKAVYQRLAAFQSPKGYGIELNQIGDMTDVVTQRSPFLLLSGEYGIGKSEAMTLAIAHLDSLLKQAGLADLVYVATREGDHATIYLSTQAQADVIFKDHEKAERIHARNQHLFLGGSLLVSFYSLGCYLYFANRMIEFVKEKPLCYDTSDNQTLVPAMAPPQNVLYYKDAGFFPTSYTYHYVFKIFLDLLYKVVSFFSFFGLQHLLSKDSSTAPVIISEPGHHIVLGGITADKMNGIYDGVAKTPQMKYASGRAVLRGGFGAIFFENLHLVSPQAQVEVNHAVESRYIKIEGVDRPTFPFYRMIVASTNFPDQIDARLSKSGRTKNLHFSPTLPNTPKVREALMHKCCLFLASNQLLPISDAALHSLFDAITTPKGIQFNRSVLQRLESASHVAKTTQSAVILPAHFKDDRPVVITQSIGRRKQGHMRRAMGFFEAVHHAIEAQAGRAGHPQSLYDGLPSVTKTEREQNPFVSILDLSGHVAQVKETCDQYIQQLLNIHQYLQSLGDVIDPSQIEWGKLPSKIPAIILCGTFGIGKTSIIEAAQKYLLHQLTQYTSAGQYEPRGIVLVRQSPTGDLIHPLLVTQSGLDRILSAHHNRQVTRERLSTTAPFGALAIAMVTFVANFAFKTWESRRLIDHYDQCAIPDVGQEETTMIQSLTGNIFDQSGFLVKEFFEYTFNLIALLMLMLTIKGIFNEANKGRDMTPEVYVPPALPKPHYIPEHLSEVVLSGRKNPHNSPDPQKQFNQSPLLQQFFGGSIHVQDLDQVTIDVQEFLGGLVSSRKVLIGDTIQLQLPFFSLVLASANEPDKLSPVLSHSGRVDMIHVPATMRIRSEDDCRNVLIHIKHWVESKGLLPLSNGAFQAYFTHLNANQHLSFSRKEQNVLVQASARAKSEKSTMIQDYHIQSAIQASGEPEGSHE